MSAATRENLYGRGHDEIEECEDPVKANRAAYSARWYRQNRAKAMASTLAWRKKNPERHNATRRRARLRKALQTHVLTELEYAAMLKRQGGRCGICKRLPGKMRLCIDHDHILGHVRGLLCPTCNLNLGILEGWAEQFEVAIEEYLK